MNHMPESINPAPDTGEKPKSRGIIVGIVVAAVAVVAILCAGVGVSYEIFAKRSENGAIRWIANVLPIPAAKVGNRTVLYRDYLESLDTVRIFVNSPAAKEQKLDLTVDAALEKNVLEKLVRQAALEEMAAAKGVAVTDPELRAFFTDVVAAASGTTSDIGVYLLENYGWNEEDFRQNVLRPALIEQRLTEKYSQDNQGDAAAFTTAVEARLKQSDVVRYLRF